jgi:hypothetical protein
MAADGWSCGLADSYGPARSTSAQGQANPGYSFVQGVARSPRYHPAEAAGKSEQDEHTPRRIVAKPPENQKFLHDAFFI